MQQKQWVFPAILFVLITLAVSGCSSPTPTPQPSVDTPQDAVTRYWEAIDRGDYNAAFDLAHMTQMGTRQHWIDQYRAMLGENRSYITIHSFNVTGVTALDPTTFPGNFTAINSVVVETDVAYYGKNTTGPSQFAAVKETNDGWKFYGSY
jgi:hypothetical protein